MRLPGLVVLFACVLMLVACDDDGDAPTPTASPSAVATPASPTPVSGWATPPATADPRMDQIIRYAVTGDEQSLRAFMRISAAPCTHMQSPGSGAACRDGEPEGTLVDTFSVGVCDGNGARTEDIELLPDEPVALYAVAIRPSNIGDRTAILFRPESGGGAGKDFHFDYDDGQIVGLYVTCGGAENFAANASSFLIPPA